MTDPDVVTNVAAQKLRADKVNSDLQDVASDVAELRTATDRLREELARRGVEVPATAPNPVSETPDSVDVPDWETLTAENRAWLADTGMRAITLDDLLTPEQLDDLERFDPKGRERWAASDYVTVGTCAVIGLLATAFDDQIDAAVKNGLAGLSQTVLFEHFEQRGKNLPIDYTGRRFGGPGHRVRSSGHDIGRPWEALRHIRDGQFHGIYWDHGQRIDFFTTQTPDGTPYLPHDMPEALVLWLMHLMADMVTTKSLPLPGWSKLYEANNRQLRNSRTTSTARMVRRASTSAQ
jgi:hypothetical protein